MLGKKTSQFVYNSVGPFDRDDATVTTSLAAWSANSFPFESTSPAFQCRLAIVD